MADEREAERAAALRALHSADEHAEALRAGTLDAEGRRRAIAAIADAVEQALRRRLRDAEGTPLQVRLKALAADELREDEVLAELRQHDLLSMELAAAIHDLFEVRRRLGAGAEPELGDDQAAVRTARRLERELEAPIPVPRPSPHAAGLDETLAEPTPPARAANRRPPWPWLAAAAAALIVLVIVLFARGGEDPRLAQGITLFRSGAYADAAPHFWRYAEANPDDPTPRLYLARIHRRMGRPDLAGPELRRALELAPEDPQVHSELGFLLIETGRHDVAVERFRAALRLDPDLAEGWIGLVRALRESGREDAAERVLEQAPQRVRELTARRQSATPARNP